MARLSLAIGALLLAVEWSLGLGAPSELGPEAGGPDSSSEQLERGLEYALKRSLAESAGGASGLEELLMEARGRRASGSGMGSSFIRFGRAGKALEAVSQPHTRSDIIIRYGRDELKNRLARLRQERMQRLARLALVCANKSQEDAAPNSAEERIIREMCRDAPLHPTVPDFV